MKQYTVLCERFDTHSKPFWQITLRFQPASRWLDLLFLIRSERLYSLLAVPCCLCIYSSMFIPLQMIDAQTVKDVATKYLYDRCPAVVGIGKFLIPRKGTD